MPRPKPTAEEVLKRLLYNDASEEEKANLRALEEKKRKQLLEDENALEAEAVLLYFDLKGAGFVKQKCPVCLREFAYKYAIASIATKKVKNNQQELVVSYKKYTGSFKCSNQCRLEALAEMGIDWRPSRLPEERWRMNIAQTNGIIPLIVPPDALALVEAKLQESNERNSSLAT